jgi:aspartate aminotransferase-like enzyme
MLYAKCRLAVDAWGLKNCCQKEEYYSASVTAIVVPPNIDSGEIVTRAWKKYNLSLGVGLNKVAGKVFRIGHVGHLNEVNYLFLKDPSSHIARILLVQEKQIFGLYLGTFHSVY